MTSATGNQVLNFTKSCTDYPLETVGFHAIDTLEAPNILRYTFSTAQAAQAFAKNLILWSDRLPPHSLVGRDVRPFADLKPPFIPNAEVISYEVLLTFPLSAPAVAPYICSQMIGQLGNNPQKSMQERTAVPFFQFGKPDERQK